MNLLALALEPNVQDLGGVCAKVLAEEQRHAVKALEFGDARFILLLTVWVFHKLPCLRGFQIFNLMELVRHRPRERERSRERERGQERECVCVYVCVCVTCRCTHRLTRTRTHAYPRTHVVKVNVLSVDEGSHARGMLGTWLAHDRDAFDLHIVCEPGSAPQCKGKQLHAVRSCALAFPEPRTCDCQARALTARG